MDKEKKYTISIEITVDELTEIYRRLQLQKMMILSGFAPEEIEDRILERVLKAGVSVIKKEREKNHGEEEA